MKITRQDVENVAVLSRLELSGDQVDQYQNILNAILECAHKLNELDTREIEPASHVLPLKNVMRQDKITPSLPRELALSNSPEQEDGYFKVAKIMEG